MATTVTFPLAISSWLLFCVFCFQFVSYFIAVAFFYPSTTFFFLSCVSFSGAGIDILISWCADLHVRCMSAIGMLCQPCSRLTFLARLSSFFSYLACILVPLFLLLSTHFSFSILHSDRMPGEEENLAPIFNSTLVGLPAGFFYSFKVSHTLYSTVEDTYTHTLFLLNTHACIYYICRQLPRQHILSNLNV